MEIGEHWAYREKKGVPLVEVEVLALGQPGKTSPRIKIQHLDDLYEGRVEWSPKIRLKVRWDERLEYEARESRWAAVQSSETTRAEYRAYHHVFLHLTPKDILDWESWGVTMILDERRLLDFTGLEKEQLQSSVSFVEDGALVVPREVTLRIARSIALRNPDALLAWIEAEENEEARLRKTHKLSMDDWLHPDWESPKDAFVRSVAKYRQEEIEMRDLLRGWLGEPGMTTGQRIAALEQLVIKFVSAAERAIDDLPQARTRKATATKVELMRLVDEASRWF
ncbi:hypothetical protein ACFJGV_15290 [Cnuibacter sp. UC19_7]|uniref:hypothetical protein n=1 Tax=Cnuibacter sp. UC19_7 TaxID=3350166 RepID=UPI0036705024